MSEVVRYAAAIYHLGPRTAFPWHAARSPRRLALHGGRTDARGRRAARLAARGAASAALQPPRLRLARHAHARRTSPAVLEWIARYPPSGAHPGWMEPPQSLRLREWALLAADVAPRPVCGRQRLLASIEAQADCLADNLEWHLRGDQVLGRTIALKRLATRFRGSALKRWERREVAVRARARRAGPARGGHVGFSPMCHTRLACGRLDPLNMLAEPDGTRAARATPPHDPHFVASLRRRHEGEIAPLRRRSTRNRFVAACHPRFGAPPRLKTPELRPASSGDRL